MGAEPDRSSMSHSIQRNMKLNPQSKGPLQANASIQVTAEIMRPALTTEKTCFVQLREVRRLRHIDGDCI